MDNTGELKTGLDGSRYQEQLANFIVTNKLKTIVETGYGVSTVFIAYAIKHNFDMQDSRLFSVDPKPWFDKMLTMPQHELINQNSYDGLPDLFLKTGAWDMFLHDGNHDIKAQTFDLEFSYSCLRNGGVIACDDYTWGNHKAWQDFLERHGLKELKMGDVAYAFKTGHAVLTKDKCREFSKWCYDIANEKEGLWLLMGNKNSEAFQ